MIFQLELCANNTIAKDAKNVIQLLQYVTESYTKA